jgi:hypothetical protein
MDCAGHLFWAQAATTLRPTQRSESATIVKLRHYHYCGKNHPGSISQCRLHAHVFIAPVYHLWSCDKGQTCSRSLVIIGGVRARIDWEGPSRPSHGEASMCPIYFPA